ncbi:MAG: hypothetical protein QF903_13945 [Planctomycetota bacterium]|jgi:hypothetical protein|nr:hypothetical protein [Planctomycetota bacterium]MDP6763223.1 hypothetical protein [Planctomycetota bacterium]MDP6990568.1 hypothetical protein [Planctomycetota bacterium]
MKTQLLPTILVGLVAGAAGAMLSTAIGGSPASDTSEPVVLDDGGADLERMIASLQEENEVLSRRVFDLEQAPPPAAVRSAAPLEATEEQRETDERLRAVVAALADPDAPMPPEWRESVGLALQDIRAAEEAERAEERRLRAEERMDQRMEELSIKLGLDTYQSGRMRVVLTEESLARDELRTVMRESGDWASARSAMTELRDKTNASLAEVLTPQQLETYQADQSAAWGRFGSGRGGRGGGGQNDSGSGR